MIHDDLEIQIDTPNQPRVLALIEELDEYLGELYPPESNHLLDIDSLSGPNVCFVTAKVCNQIIGFGAVRFYGREYAEIKRMYVKKGLRGQKLGKKILAFLERMAKDNGFTTVRLETGIYQKSAGALYANAGYLKVEPFGDYRDDPLSVYYEKTLK